MPNDIIQAPTLSSRSKSYYGLQIVVICLIALLLFFGVSVSSKLEESVKTMEIQLDEMSSFNNKLMQQIQQMLHIVSSLNSSTAIEREMIDKSNKLIVIKAAYEAINKIKNGISFAPEVEKMLAHQGSEGINELLSELQIAAKNQLLSNRYILQELEKFSMQLSGNVTEIDLSKPALSSKSSNHPFEQLMKVQEIKEIEYKASLDYTLQEIRENSLAKAITFLQKVVKKYPELNETIQMLQLKNNATLLLQQLINKIIQDV